MRAELRPQDRRQGLATRDWTMPPGRFGERIESMSEENVARHVRGLPARAQMVLRAMVHLRCGTLVFRTPEGRMFRIDGREEGPHATLVLHNWKLPHRAFIRGTMGVAESYLDGDWDSSDVTAFLQLFLANQEMAYKFAGGAKGLLSVLARLRHWLNRNTKSGSRRNISAHYDLGNAFYEQWLDATMSYSSALYATGANDLVGAQNAKYRALAQATGIGPGDRVLEIGCGWGGFAEFAAREIGCHVTGLTISKQQYDYASRRLNKAGLAERTDIRFQDYRDEAGRYDGIISIEMFEAVGERYWQTYFQKLRSCLRAGGRAGLQVITIDRHAFEHYRRNPDFIQRYVFPGGMLPTADHLRDIAASSGLDLVRHDNFGNDYARTLAEWRSRFHAAWKTIEPLGFDDRFRRLWDFYLHYCEAGFLGKNLDVRHLVYE